MWAPNSCTSNVCVDVAVIIGLGIYHRLRSNHVFEDIIIDFGVKKDHRAISLKLLAESLGEPRCQALPFFHAFTGSGTTSAFKSIGKKKAYEALKAFAEAGRTFAFLQNNPFYDIQEADDRFKTIQRFVIVMYSKTSTLSNVNEARLQLYFQRTHNIETIPPTENALLLHTKRAIFQSGVWARCVDNHQNLPSPQGFGWKKSDEVDWQWKPIWMTQHEASKEFREFAKCSCKGESCTRCACYKASLRCTLLCSCKCENQVTYE